MGRLALTLCLVAAALSATAPALAHDPWELDVAVGYRFGGALDVESDSETGRISLDGAPAFSAIVGYRLQPDGFIFLNYSRQSTTLQYVADGGGSASSTGLSTEYLQFGGNLEITRGRWVPYLGFSVGTTRLAATDLGGDDWRFSAVVDGGVKFELARWLHLRLLGRLPFTFLAGDSTVLCAAGGCRVRLDGVPLIQGDVEAGLGVSF
jgi:hypothetical protein